MIDADVWDALLTSTATAIHGAAVKATPVNADEFGYIDSADPWKLKKFTWAQLKAGISSTYGSGVAAWLANPTSANLYSAMVDKTGTNLLVFNTAPTFATSINFNADTGIYKINGVNVVRMKGSNCYYFGPGGSPNAGNNNIVMGTGGGGMNSSATSNVFVGFLAGNNVTSGSDNLFLGIYAGWNVTTGSSNTFFGSSAGGSVNTANFNAAFGRESLQQNQKSFYNTAVGYRAGNSLTNSVTIDGLNVFIGALCSNSSVTTGVCNTFIGAQINAGSNVSNTIIIADGTGSHRFVVNSSGNVGINAPLTGSVAIAARLHVVDTSANHARFGHDTSNYFTIAVSSAGAVTFDAVGASAGFTFNDDITLANAKNIILNTSTGTKIGTSTTQKLGFWNATPVVQSAAYTVSNYTTDRTIDKATATLGEVTDVLLTLIADLKLTGIIG